MPIVVPSPMQASTGLQIVETSVCCAVFPAIDEPMHIEKEQGPEQLGYLTLCDQPSVMTVKVSVATLHTDAMILERKSASGF